MKQHFFLLLICFTGSSSVTPATVYTCNDGKLAFVSDAPLEIIRSESNDVRGAVDIAARSFLFTVNINTFEGFNSALQREHFNENYMESDEYPTASFKGKLIEEVDLGVDGTYDIRAKGILEVHGVPQERIIRGTIDVKEGTLRVTSDFTVLLEEHSIKIPRVVYQKISPEIQVKIDCLLKPVK